MTAVTYRSNGVGKPISRESVPVKGALIVSGAHVKAPCEFCGGEATQSSKVAMGNIAYCESCKPTYDRQYRGLGADGKPLPIIPTEIRIETANGTRVVKTTWRPNGDKLNFCAQLRKAAKESGYKAPRKPRKAAQASSPSDPLDDLSRRRTRLETERKRLDRDVRELVAAGDVPVAKIARALGVSRQRVYQLAA